MRHRIILLVVAALAVPLAASAGAAPAPAAGAALAAPPAAALGGKTAPALPVAARGARGGGFRTGRGRSRGRSPYGRRPYRRNRGLGRSILRTLGIAWLLSAVFGWGAGGGSPFGLLIILAFVTWLVLRSRSRRRMYAAYR